MFLEDLDSAVTDPVELHCFGGFVVTLLYGLQRPTRDVDVLVVRPDSAKATLQAIAGEGSPLSRRHRVHLQIVTVVQAIPDNYEDRLTEMFHGRFRNLRLFALDPYDLALSKLGRNAEKDREDVRHLARAVPFDPDVLRSRYEQEMRPYVANEEREGLTLKLWIEMIEEDRQDNL